MSKFTAVAVLAASTLLAACVPQQGPTVVQPVYVAPVQQQVVPFRPAPGCDTRFRIANQSGLTVRELYFSPSAVSGWGADQLGRSMLPPGRFVNYRAANAARYDFRVVWVNGRAAELRGVNICAARQVTIRNSGLSAF
ncbi:MAG TPA: hypothetical protein VGN96_18980 [Roseococcus sp.]|jgi:hypothetical protein|nr:hypothetical protein [Roseococcus sp.]